jgi:hypothetical protein
MTAMSWAVTAVVVALVVASVAYLVSLRSLPTAQRTDVPIFDRMGHIVDEGRNEEPRRS